MNNKMLAAIGACLYLTGSYGGGWTAAQEINRHLRASLSTKVIPIHNGEVLLPDSRVESESTAGLPQDASPYDAPPEVVRRVEPKYPEAAVKDKLGGTVWMKLWVDETGGVSKATVISSDNPLFDAPAREAALRWKFKPARIKEKPVGSWVRIPFRFNLANAAEGIPIETIDGPLNQSLVSKILDIFETRVFVYSYNIPIPYSIKWSLAQYEDGNQTGGFVGGGTTENRSGLVDTVLVLVRKGDQNSVRFRIEQRFGAIQTGAYQLKNYGATRVASLGNLRLREDSRTPILVYAMIPRSGDFGKPTDELEFYLKKYRSVIALFAELKFER